MKQLLAAAFLTISILAIGQDYNFKPNWKVGDSKTLLIAQREREYEEGELLSDTTIFLDANIKVLKENDESYTLEILYENIALRSTIELYDKLGEELKDYKNLKLIYEVNKETAESELVNWKEAQSFMNESFDLITGVFEKQAPEMASVTGIVFAPIKEIFKSKENIEAYMETEIGFIIIPFNKGFKIGQKITTTEAEENPFNPMQEITGTTILALESVDSKNNTCEISQSVELDLSEFKEMMKNMMLNLFQSLGADDSITAIKIKEIDDFEMDMTNRQVITFDYKSTWVTKVVTTEAVVTIDPEKGKRKVESISTVTVN